MLRSMVETCGRLYQRVVFFSLPSDGPMVVKERSKGYHTPGRDLVAAALTGSGNIMLAHLGYDIANNNLVQHHSVVASAYPRTDVPTTQFTTMEVSWFKIT